jgi:hypothetical protein
LARPLGEGPGQRLRFWGAFALPAWALMGAVGAAYLFLESTGPVQAGMGTGIWLSLAPPESPPAWTGLGSLGPFLFPLARLALLAWAPVIVLLLVGLFHLPEAQRPYRRPGVWPCAVMAGTALGVLAVVSYRLPPEVWSAGGPVGYVRVPVINWYEIPAVVGFLIVALAMWWLMRTPERPAAAPAQ